MGGSSKKQTVGYKYKLGMHMVFCHGPVDKVSQLKVDDREIWSGAQSSGRVLIDKPEVFGGESREGGVQGEIDILSGSVSQNTNDYLQENLGEDIPAYRGVLSLVLRKLYLGMNPYLKNWSMKATRVFTAPDGSAQWEPSLAAITDYENTHLIFVIDRAIQNTAFPIGSSTVTYFNATLKEFLISFAEVEESTTDVSVINYGQTEIELMNFSSINKNNQAEYVTRLQNQNRLDGQYGNVGNAYSQINDIIAGNSRGKQKLIVLTSFYAYGTLACVPILSQLQNSYPNIQYFIASFTYGTNEVNHEVLDLISPSGETQAKYNYESSAFINNAINSSPSMNPVHVIYEVLTNKIWGSMGIPDEDINLDNFKSVAQTLLNEGMGFSLLWDRQTSSEEFIQDVLRHINAMLPVNRRTGKYELKLIRDDYNESELVRINDEICNVLEYKRTDPSECVNSVTVVYTGEGGADGTITVSETALISKMGSVVNTTIQYPAFTNSNLASRVAARDLKTLSSPILSIKIEVLNAREDVSSFNIGDVFLFEYADYHDGAVVMRILDISLGNGKSNMMRITASEDIYGLPQSSQVGNEDSGWVDPIPNNITNPSWMLAEEMSYYELAQALGDNEANNQLNINPDTSVVLATAPIRKNVLDYNIRVNDGLGFIQTSDDCDPVPYAILQNEVTTRNESTLTYKDDFGLDSVEMGTYLVINNEYMEVKVIDPNNRTITVGRGVLDTVPKAKHPEGSRIVFADNYWGSTTNQYLESESVEVKTVAHAPSGSAPVSTAPSKSVTIESRAIKPYPPSNVLINGESYPESINTLTGTIEWGGRNRLYQTGGNSFISHFDPSITAEEGTEYIVTFYDQDEVKSVQTVSGNNTLFDLFDFKTKTAKIKLESVRDGYTSYQSIVHTFEIPENEKLIQFFNAETNTQLPPPGWVVTNFSASSYSVNVMQIVSQEAIFLNTLNINSNGQTSVTKNLQSVADDFECTVVFKTPDNIDSNVKVGFIHGLEQDNDPYNFIYLGNSQVSSGYPPIFTGTDSGVNNAPTNSLSVPTNYSNQNGVNNVWALRYCKKGSIFKYRFWELLDGYDGDLETTDEPAFWRGEYHSEVNLKKFFGFSVANTQANAYFYKAKFENQVSADMPVKLVGQSATLWLTNSSLTLTYNVAVEIGDLMVISLMRRESIVSGLEGWTLFSEMEEIAPTHYQKHAIYYKYATLDDLTTISSTNSVTISLGDTARTQASLSCYRASDNSQLELVNAITGTTQADGSGLVTLPDYVVSDSNCLLYTAGNCILQLNGDYLTYLKVSATDDRFYIGANKTKDSANGARTVNCVQSIPNPKTIQNVIETSAINTNVSHIQFVIRKS